MVGGAGGRIGGGWIGGGRGSDGGRGRGRIVGQLGGGVEHPGVARELEGEAQEEGDDVQAGQGQGHPQVAAGGGSATRE